MLSQRIERLKRRVLEESIPHGAAIPPYPDFRRVAEACRMLAEKGDVQIAPDELIVGRAPSLPQAEAEKLWQGFVPEPAWIPSEESQRLEKDGFIIWCGNHQTPGYRAVLENGWGGIAEQIERRLAELSGSATPEELEFLSALRSLAGSQQLLIGRYGKAAAALARECSDPQRRRELEILAADCREIALRPAKGFRQACQLLYFVFLLVPDSPGRLDQLLEPYYRQDIAGGALTREEARELLAALWIKFFEFHGKDHERSGLVHLALGGVTPEGRDAVNDLSWLCLEVAEELAIIRPQIAVRWHSGMPEDFLRRAVRLLRKNFGSPDFSNDEVVVEALTRIGIPLADARDYCPSGCNEIMIPGKSQMGALEGEFNLPKTLRCLFGLDPLPSGEVFKCTAPSSMAEVMGLWRGVLREVVAAICRASYEVDRERARQPWWFGASLVTEDCIGRARNISAGGALYNFCNWDAIGLAELSDSLAAVERAVFTDRLVSWEGLRDLLRDDWAGGEELRRRFLREFPHFGNQSPETDAIAAQILEWVVAEFACHTPFRGGCYTLGTLAGYENAHAVFGAATGATPDGRKAGEAFAGSLGPAPGRDRSGVTAMLNSVASLPCVLLPTSTTVNVRFDPGILDAGEDRLAALIAAYFAEGGPQLQITLADAAILLEAQSHPELFSGLMVRVAGYSAKFTSLDKKVQDEVISRTINA